MSELLLSCTGFLLAFSFFKINLYLFIYFWCTGSSLLHAELSLAAVHGLLFAVASFVAEHGLQGTWASGVVAYGLSCPVADEIFPDRGWNPCPLHRFFFFF